MQVRQIAEQRLEIGRGPSGVHPLDALVELLSCEPASREVLAEI